MRAVLVLGLFLALAAPARASTAYIDVGYECETDQPCNRYGGGWSWAIINYVAAPGETNRLTVASNGQALILTDPAATIRAVTPCVSIDAHTASCDAGKPQFGADMLTVQLGDRDDTATIAPGSVPPADLHAGAGDDVLTGGREDDWLDPGRGTDRLDGGEGVDLLNYGALHHAVTVDLAAGRSSEADRFTGIDAVLATDRADHLLGGPGHNVLYGEGGDDVLSGRGGDDQLSGGVGKDHLDGGPGNDTLDGDPHPSFDAPGVLLSADVLRGGPGNDVLTDAGGANRLEGGRGDDRLSGGRGRDRLDGGPGTDVIRGGRGLDRFRGGSGADVLTARDGRDERVDCGRGRDRATVDAKDRVRACERLRRGVYTPRR